MNTQASLPAIGSRATVAPVSSVAEYLHGKTGVVESHRPSITEGQQVAVIRFDVPVSRHWSPSIPLETIGLRADQIA